MKHLLLGSLFALAGVLGCNRAARAAEPGCEPPNVALLRAEVGSERAGGHALRLSGDQAERFFDYLNDKVGRDTDYWGDGVIIARYPALGFDSVAIVDDGCVDETKMIRLDPPVAMLAVQAAMTSSQW